MWLRIIVATQSLGSSDTAFSSILRISLSFLKGHETLNSICKCEQVRALCRALLLWIKQLFRKALRKSLWWHKIFQISWKRTWLGQHTFCCGTQTPLLWYIPWLTTICWNWSCKRWYYSSFDEKSVMYLWSLFPFQVSNAFGTLLSQFSAYINSRCIMRAWLLEHTGWCIKSSCSWLGWERDWEDWPVWFEGHPLFSSECRYRIYWLFFQVFIIGNNLSWGGSRKYSNVLKVL